MSLYFNANINVSDTATTSEFVLVNATSSLIIIIQETTITYEIVNVNLVTTLSKADTFTTSENISVVPTSLINKADTFITSETVKVSAVPQIIAGDQTITSEHIDVLRSNMRDLSVGDTATTSENLQLGQPAYVLSVTDITQTSELVQVNETYTIRNKTEWRPQSGTGYVIIFSGDLITNSGSFLIDNSNDLIIANSSYDIPKYDSNWAEITKTKTHWTPASGQGYVKTVGNEEVITNG